MSKSLCGHGYIEGHCTYCGLVSVIDRLQDGGDLEVLKYLGYYKEQLEHYHEIDTQFRDILRTQGEDGLKKITINALRAMADQLERKSGLGIYKVDLPKDTPPASKSVMDHIEVTVSYPWGG